MRGEQLDAACLIAAQDLLLAAKDTLDYWDSTGFADCEEDCDCIVDQMRAAVAKAEGRDVAQDATDSTKGRTE